MCNKHERTDIDHHLHFDGGTTGFSGPVGLFFPDQYRRGPVNTRARFLTVTVNGTGRSSFFGTGWTGRSYRSRPVPDRFHGSTSGWYTLCETLWFNRGSKMHLFQNLNIHWCFRDIEYVLDEELLDKDSLWMSIDHMLVWSCGMIPNSATISWYVQAASPWFNPSL